MIMLIAVTILMVVTVTKKECSLVSSCTGAGFRGSWREVSERRSLRAPQLLCLLTSDYCDSEKPVMRLEIFFPPDKKALRKDDRRSPLFTIFLPYSLNRVRGCCYPRTVTNASLGFRWTVHVLYEGPSILCL